MGEARGREFFRKLAALKPEMRKGHILVAQLVAAGELSVCLTIYSGNADSIKAKGGPIDWVAVEPLVGRPQAIALAKNAPHPHAALLFADFVLSPEGQKLLGDMGRVPSSRTQKTLLDRHKYVMVDPIKWTDEAPQVGEGLERAVPEVGQAVAGAFPPDRPRRMPYRPPCAIAVTRAHYDLTRISRMLDPATKSSIGSDRKPNGRARRAPVMCLSSVIVSRTVRRRARAWCRPCRSPR